MKRAFKWLAIPLLLIVAGLAIFNYTPDTDAAAMRAKYGGPASQFVDLGDGLKVHVRDEGPRGAPVIVLLHGSNASLHTWDEWAKRLSGQYRVIRYDHPGHGLTGPHPKRDYSTAAFAQVLDRLTTKLGVGKFVLAGNSMGGAIAWNYARARSGRLRGLVLVDSSGEPEPESGDLPIGFRIAQTPGLRDLALHFTPRSLIASSLRQSVSNQAVASEAAIDRYWELLRYPGNRQATIDRFATPREPVARDALACIVIPTLILWGAEDKLIPASAARWFADAIPNSRVIVYPGIGHIPMEETAERSANDLASWLATLPAPR